MYSEIHLLEGLGNILWNETMYSKLCKEVIIGPNKIVLDPYQPRAITIPPPLSSFSSPYFPFFIHSSSFIFPFVPTLPSLHLHCHFFFHFRGQMES